MSDISSDTVRYGDTIVMRSCDSDKHLFLTIIPRHAGRSNPNLLSTEVAEADKHPGCDYRWRMLPSLRSNRKWGDPVAFADRVRLQIIDEKNQSRMLAVSHLDSRSIMAERRSAGMESCTWWLSYSKELALGCDGRTVPAGDFAPHLRYGEANYVTLVSRAGYLGAMEDPYRILSMRTVLVDDLAERGKSVWWRMYRSTSDVAHVAGREPGANMKGDTQVRSLSMA